MQVSSLLVSKLKAVLENSSHYSAQTEGRLNDTRSVFLLHHIHHLLLKTDVLFSQGHVSTLSSDLNLTLSIKLFLKLNLFLFTQILEVLYNRGRVLFKLFADNLSVECNSSLLLRSWLFEAS